MRFHLILTLLFALLSCSRSSTAYPVLGEDKILPQSTISPPSPVGAAGPVSAAVLITPSSIPQPSPIEAAGPLSATGLNSPFTIATHLADGLVSTPSPAAESLAPVETSLSQDRVDSATIDDFASPSSVPNTLETYDESFPSSADDGEGSDYEQSIEDFLRRTGGFVGRHRFGSDPFQSCSGPLSGRCRIGQ